MQQVTHDAAVEQHLVPLVLTASQVGELLQVSKDCVLNLHRCRQLTAIKVGRSLRFRRVDVQKFIDETEPANGKG